MTGSRTNQRLGVSLPVLSVASSVRGGRWPVTTVGGTFVFYVSSLSVFLSGGWDRFIVQDKYSVGGFFCECLLRVIPCCGRKHMSNADILPPLRGFSF